MNPCKSATTPAERFTRARLILLSLGLPCAVAYARKHLTKTDQLCLAQEIRKEHGVARAAETMRLLAFSIEAALHELVGPGALNRYEYMRAWEAV